MVPRSSSPRRLDLLDWHWRIASPGRFLCRPSAATWCRFGLQLAAAAALSGLFLWLTRGVWMPPAAERATSGRNASATGGGIDFDAAARTLEEKLRAEFPPAEWAQMEARLRQQEDERQREIARSRAAGTRDRWLIRVVYAGLLAPLLLATLGLATSLARLPTARVIVERDGAGCVSVEFPRWWGRARAPLDEASALRTSLGVFHRATIRYPRHPQAFWYVAFHRGTSSAPRPLWCVLARTPPGAASLRPPQRVLDFQSALRDAMEPRN